MHVSRGGWLGQTYALAKVDDSFEGKKSGIRRSKEERKGMVETFIKRYQKSNNGDFPSLNLTRKEVGGSFYTVREIVREIIQENRVLGPPKSTLGDENMENLNSFLEDSPLGSMAVDVDVDVHVVESMGGQKDEVNGVVANETQKHKILEDVAVGASSASVSHEINGKSNEREVVDGGVEEKDTEIGDMAADVVDVQLEGETTHSVPKLTPTSASQKHSSSEENIVVDDVKKYDKVEDSLPADVKTINGANTPNLHNIPVQPSTLDETNANLNKSIHHLNSIYQKRRTTATLNRINLESWEAASNHQTHQLVKFIKSFVTAFVKFWTE